VILECNEEISPQHDRRAAQASNLKELKVLFIDNLNVGPYLRDTLLMDKIENPEEAVMEIYRRVRPGDPPTPETATNLFTNVLFFNPERYDLSKVGRLKLNSASSASRSPWTTRCSPSATFSRRFGTSSI
jgi:DNA-directed RNA polymerase subunit beta